MAKYPKTVNRYCPTCRKHTEQKVTQAKKKTRGTAHPLSWGSRNRIERRGRGKGFGNTGKYSKPAKPKMTGKKQSKKTDFRYECKICKKQSVQRKGFRAKKVEFV